eukprot:3846386-Ditylum_brightwellii.AAC.1
MGKLYSLPTTTNDLLILVPITGAKFQAYIDINAPSTNVLSFVAFMNSPLNLESSSVISRCDNP